MAPAVRDQFGTCERTAGDGDNAHPGRADPHACWVGLLVEGRSYGR
ncbi:hypothetical protein SAMN06295937_102055 [Sphingopyxis flava]|uniref:Uncharacterized protein n=1 Tax=Sphingopyxis flava TaxID=1507287 RepID=A0A1T5EB74_9SPHN|nr:hypothetical protein SAMN06295937_102055 [Sphingopyxis flava]